MSLLDALAQDLRVAARTLRASPGFTLVVILTLALGVGANTAVFSVMDAVLLRTLPVRDPGALVFVRAAGSTGEAGVPPYPLFARLRDETSAFAGMAAFATDEVRVEVDGAAPESVMGQIASGRYFELLGVEPALGRLLTADDERLAPPVAVISHRFWRRRFGGDSAVLGRTIAVNGETFTIAGVTAPGFAGLLPGHPVDVTVPLTVAGAYLTDRDARWAHAVARLRPGVSARRAAAEAGAIVRAYAASTAHPDASRRALDRAELQPAARGMDTLRRRFGGPLAAMMGIVALVLLIATANVANLLLARGAARRREFAIRLATGAGRGRLVRQLLTETLLLYALGAVPAVLLAAWGVKVVGGLFAEGRRTITLDAGVDWRVLAFAAATTLGAGLAAGLLPAWTACRTDPQQGMRDGQARASESRAAGGFGRALVTVQVALSLVLLVGATAFVRTLVSLRDVDPGFRADGVLTLSVEPPGPPARAGAAGAFWARVLEGVRAVPGVRAAGLATITPLSGRDPVRSVLRVVGDRAATAEDSTVRVNHVSDGYVEALGIAVLRGRALTDRDRAGAPRVALVNETAARKLFPRRDPIGQLLTLDADAPPDAPPDDPRRDAYQVVGVVRDTKHLSVREPAPPFVLVAVAQHPDWSRRLTLTVASPLPDAQLLGSVRRAVAAADRRALISEVITARRQLASTLLAERLTARIAGAFGALALLIASVGLYGVLSYRVGQQRRAIGVRMALGATSAAVALAVVRQSAAAVAAGLAVGLPVAVVAARAADSMLWGVTSRDAAPYAVAALALLLGGLAGVCVPAARAARVAPAEALRDG